MFFNRRCLSIVLAFVTFKIISLSAEKVAWVQSSYLSRISRIIFVEKKLSCGEISAFYTEFEQFMEFLLKFMPFFFPKFPNFSPHDNFFSKNIIRDIRDKYELWVASLLRWKLSESKGGRTTNFRSCFAEL